MARTISQIQTLMLADIKADPALSGLTSTSRRAIYIALTFVFATCVFLLESLIDIFKASVETTAASSAAASSAWLQAQVLKFQYSATTPQIIQIINFAPSYATVDASLRIVSRASVITTVAGQVLIKVATGEPPAALSAPQLSALQDYVDSIGATINYTVTSQAADEIYIDASIYYQGQYSAIISQNVILAINNYLSSLPFDGQIKVSDLELTIRGVQGVNDCVLNNVKVRADTVAFSSGTYLVQAGTWISRLYPTVSGYCIPEATSGQDLANSLTFIAQ